MMKVYFFNVLWMSLCLLGALLIGIFVRPFTTSKITHKVCNEYCERLVGKICIYLFISNAGVTIHGLNNLPPPPSEELETTTTSSNTANSLPQSEPAPVYVANHASQLDIGAIYFLHRNWRWIAKPSVLFLPGVGQLLFLGGHVFIDRVKKKNAKNLYIKSHESILKDRIPMFLFPQGTRRMGGGIQRLPFKDGAFKIAIDCQTSLIPISIEIPLSAWNTYYPLSLPFIWLGFVKPPQNVILTVHPKVSTVGKTYDDLESLKRQCFDTIYSVLPSQGDDDGDNGVKEGEKKDSEKKKDK